MCFVGFVVVFCGVGVGVFLDVCVVVGVWLWDLYVVCVWFYEVFLFCVYFGFGVGGVGLVSGFYVNWFGLLEVVVGCYELLFDVF